MSKQTIITSRHMTGKRGSATTYSIGFGLSIILTLVAYFLVQQSAAPYRFLVIIVMVLAVVQLAVQLQFFIHLGHESKPRWNKLIFIFMAIIVLIVVLGSLWIMSNLHYNGMSSHETEKYIIEDERISP